MNDITPDDVLNVMAMRGLPSEREEVLRQGIELTTNSRNKSYGPPSVNLTTQMELWTIYKRAAGNRYSPGHDAAMQHLFAKIARIACGAMGHRDNYVDAATYIAIAWECQTEFDKSVKEYKGE